MRKVSICIENDKRMFQKWCKTSILWLKPRSPQQNEGRRRRGGENNALSAAAGAGGSAQAMPSSQTDSNCQPRTLYPAVLPFKRAWQETSRHRKSAKNLFCRAWQDTLHEEVNQTQRQGKGCRKLVNTQADLNTHRLGTTTKPPGGHNHKEKLTFQAEVTGKRRGTEFRLGWSYWLAFAKSGHMLEFKVTTKIGETECRRQTKR